MLPPDRGSESVEDWRLGEAKRHSKLHLRTSRADSLNAADKSLDLSPVMREWFVEWI
jgi:hypothetical protein